MSFTTRPELQGTFGVCASTHWIATAVGMKMLEAGGNAFDAAVAMGFTLNVVEPHLNGPLGDMPALIWPAGAQAPSVICGQGPAPAGATLAKYRAEGLELIPGAGLLATVIPGAFDAWMVMLLEHGTMPLREVLEPAIHYAAEGHPMLASVSAMIAQNAELFREHWPTSADTWLADGEAPAPGALFRNPQLAAFWRRLLDEAEAVQGREAQIEAARKAFAEGFVASAIEDYLQDACVLDGTGERRKGVLSGQDMAGWRATTEPAVSVDYHGWQVWKAGPWSQGPSLLQSLRLLEAQGFGAEDPLSDVAVHRIVETLKLSMADREAYYGDPDHSAVPMEVLLSPAYAARRAALIGEAASMAQRPGEVEGFEAQARAFVERAARVQPSDAGIGGGEPTFAHLASTPKPPAEGDTVHVDVIDRWGNMVSATPSGGWLQSNPVVPGLGVPLNSRAQMFWLDEGLPTTLAPGRRPRTTLTPSMAQRPDGTRFAFGTPGGDQQEQWQLTFLLRLVHQGMNLQAAIDGPLFHTQHLQASFYPRGCKPGVVMIEPNFPAPTLEALRERGHLLNVAEPWSIGRLTATSRSPEGVLKAAATPRLMQAYAAGR
ncbi:gamma-glutamyltransferase family protein [Oceanicola sp. D3]|uniref:gamma-glutamyltransferase family protein n=1 Tax=Oceanicola sp. D3 TaxID=2587163 RepID=UPI00111EF739|nr:gamma-glutamyltransferase family protein [Oceanicola sp. D3]QDC10282.1 gamma-glutamyltransferase family protein [Oceanicola sp. D3]